MNRPTIQKITKNQTFFITALLTVFLFFSLPVFAIDHYTPGTSFTIGEMVFNDDYTPASSTACYMSIWAPDGSAFASNVLMTAASSGWHYYTFPGSATEGVWPAQMSCGTAGVDLVASEKTFEITSALSNAAASATWNYSSRSLSGFGTLVSDVASATWNYTAGVGRTLTSIGTLAAEIWNDSFAPTRQLTGKALSGGENLATETYVDTATSSIITELQKKWDVYLSDFGQTTATNPYRAKLWVLNSNSVLTDANSTPTITIYDPNRTEQVVEASMIKDSTGAYHYNYTVPSDATSGMWETVVSAQVEAGKTIQKNDYWEVEGSPAQVRIVSISDTTIPSISADITITNEGSTDFFDYTYQYCVVSSENNTCGGGDDVFNGTGSKRILVGESWNTTLNATVSTAGSYWFKLVVYWGTETSGSSQSFTATEAPSAYCGDHICNGIESCATCPGDCTNCGGGGGGGGGGAGIVPLNYKRSDLNKDGKVNSVDFSILMYFWKTSPPFANTRADINVDNKVDSVDFSIMLFDWD